VSINKYIRRIKDMDINKFINTGKDIKNITGLKLNEDVLTNVIYKIKQKIKGVKNFEQLYSHVRIIINDLNIKDKEFTIDKINKYLYNQLSIDIDIVALRKSIIENFKDSDSCPTTESIICPIDAYDKEFNCASSNYTSNGIHTTTFNSDPNPWYSAYGDNKQTCIVDTSQCPPGLTFGKNAGGSNVCFFETKPAYEYATSSNLYAESKWYEWFTIPNFHLDNKFIEMKDEENNPIRLQPCGCEIGKYEFDQIPYTEFVDKCMSKMDYKFGAYTDAMPYSPIAAICLLGSVTVDTRLLQNYHSNICTDMNIQYSNFTNGETDNEKLVIIEAKKQIKEIGCQFIASEYNVSIPNSYELPKSIYAFDTDQINLAYDIASNVSYTLNLNGGEKTLRDKITYTAGVAWEAYEGDKYNDDEKFKKDMTDQLIKACKICFSQRFKIEKPIKDVEKFIKMDYIYDLFSNKTNMFAVDVINKLQMKYPEKGYLTFDINNNTDEKIATINANSMYHALNWIRTDKPSLASIPFKYNKSLSNVISFSQTFMVYLLMFFTTIIVLYVIYKICIRIYPNTLGFFDETETRQQYFNKDDCIDNLSNE
jgi:hypothetical protein